MLQRPHVQATHGLHTLGALATEVSNSSWKAGRLCPRGAAEDMKVTQQVLGDMESRPGNLQPVLYTSVLCCWAPGPATKGCCV